MKKLLFAALGLLPLLLLAPAAHAQSYTYDCLCLYSDPNGTCREYTCDAYRNNRRSYYYGNNNNNCGSQYNDCGNYPVTYRPRYWNSSSQYYNNNSSQYYNNYSNQYYNNSNDYNWYYNRYNTRPSYYNYPNYNNYDSGYPYYY